MQILITGTSRGIGLELVKQALVKGNQVIAVARNLDKAESLKALPRKNLTLIEADVTKNLKPIIEEVQKVGSLDVLINNAGVYLKDERPEDFSKTYEVNVIAPHFTTQALLPFLKKGKNPRVINITSLMGSIADNSSGGCYSYRSSKSALNMVTKSLAKDETWLTAMAVHPGWVQTDMGGVTAPVTVHDSAEGIWAVLNEAQPKVSGSFVNYQGKTLPW